MPWHLHAEHRWPLCPPEGALGNFTLFKLLIGVVRSRGLFPVVLHWLPICNLLNKPRIDIIRTCILTFLTLIQGCNTYTIYMYFDIFDICNYNYCTTWKGASWYRGLWSLLGCKPHTVPVSQASISWSSWQVGSIPWYSSFYPGEVEWSGCLVLVYRIFCGLDCQWWGMEQELTCVNILTFLTYDISYKIFSTILYCQKYTLVLTLLTYFCSPGPLVHVDALATWIWLRRSLLMSPSHFFAFWPVLVEATCQQHHYGTESS